MDTRSAPRGRFSGGRFCPPARVRGCIPSRSPCAPQQTHGEFPFGEEDVDESVSAASRAARAWASQSLASRLAHLGRVRAQLLGQRSQLLACLQHETGRPPWECQREVQGLAYRIDQVQGDAELLLAEISYQNLPGRAVSRPLGTVVVIGPAQLPLGTSHTHVVAALAAGNSVVWKPSPLCPASAQRYAEAFAAAGLPPGVFNMILGDDEVGARLASHPLVDGVVFTGATANGLALRRRLEDKLDRRLVLHLGAKNAAVVLDDADLELAAYEIATGAFLSAGQRCTALSRALVQGEVLDEFLHLLASVCATLRFGPPAEQPFAGPMLTKERMDTFLAARAQAPRDGAEVLLAGERLDRPGFFVTPSVHLVHARRPDAAYQRDEHFGPDLAIYPVRDIDDALPLADDTPFGLCAALFSRSPQRWRRFSEELRAGALFWNRSCSAPSGRMPFGGAKGSCVGGYGGAHAILALRREVSVLERRSDTIEVLPGTLEEPPAAPAEAR